MDNLQLSELAQKAKNGDMAAFEKLYIELSPDIYAIACEITKNKEESRDLMQDCFVAAMENISTLNEPDKIKNWLIRIAANKSRDYIKKKKPSALTEDQYEVIYNIEDEDVSVIPEASLETEEQIEDVNEILGCLTEEKRLCLLLRFRYDMSYAEIAQELGITESAVKSRISRAKDDIEKEAEKRKKKGLPLFGIAPFGLVIFALKRSADITAAAFAGSTAQATAFAGITAASQVGIAAASTTAASTTAKTATGIGTKVAAMSVAQKVVAGVAAATVATGSATVTTVVVKNKIEAKDETTTAYVEEVTTAPDYGFENETVFVPAVSETEISTTGHSASNNPTSANRSSTALQTKATEKSPSVASTTKTVTTTTKKPTTTKATTTKKETTTKKAATTKATTTEEETTTVRATTTRAATTTTTKATTTEASGRATVTVTVWGEETSTTKTLYFEAGEKITATEIENRLSDEYGIEAIADNINITAEAGGNYTATAYE